MVIIDRSEQNSHVEFSAQNTDNLLTGKGRRRRLGRSLKLLPNIFTLSNAFFGFCAIVLVAQKNPQAAAYCILLGASMDALDGRIARLTNSTSPLGMQLDSLSDAITFCVAPAFMMYLWDIGSSDLFGFVSSAMYLLAGIFRLARFNITSQLQTTYFLGLPTTLAGCFLSATVLSFPIQDYAYLPELLMVTLAYLMISRWRFPTFKQASKRRMFVFAIATGVIVMMMGLNKTFISLCASYFALSFVSTLWKKKSPTPPTI